jgi:ABC-type multidrug transport system ATPase subunit
VIVTAHDLWKRYGRFDALKGLAFQVPEGSAFALVGPEWSRQDHHNQDSRERT